MSNEKTIDLPGGFYTNSFVMLDPATGNTLSKIPTQNSLPNVTSATIVALTTSAIGVNYVAFDSSICSSLNLANNTGVVIEYRRGANGVAMEVPTGTTKTILGITNANQIDIRRADTSNTQVTIKAELLVS